MDNLSIVLLCIIVVVIIIAILFVVHKKKDINNKKKDVDKPHRREIDENNDDLDKNEIKTLKDEIKTLKDEIKTLKNEIQKLQDDVEEKEYDIDDCEKKLKKKCAECVDIEREKDEAQKKNKEISDVLSYTKRELEEKEDDLKLKNEALLFIQEILSAQVVSDAYMQKLYHKVDSVCDFVSGELKDSINSIKSLSDITMSLNTEKWEEVFDVGLKKWAITTKKEWINRKTTIAFVGQFSAGKTSIVNRILSQDNPNVLLLPVGAEATTAIPTYISGGRKERYHFVTPNDVMKEISEVTFKRVNKEVLHQVKGVSSLIKYFVMTYENKLLDNLSILDTPGFSSNDKEDAQRTIDVINECDALFWVVDVHVGSINRSSIKVIKEHLKKPLYIVINKVDSKPSEGVDDTEAYIKKTLQEEKVPVKQFIRFSKRNPLNDIMKPILSITNNKNLKSYIDELYQFVNEVAKKVDADVKKNRDEYIRFEKESGRLAELYYEAIEVIRDNCQKAQGIPNKGRSRFGLKVQYQMSKEEFENICALLDTISDESVDKLRNLFNEHVETQEQLQRAYSDYMNMRAKWQNIDKCKEQLNKLLKPFR